MIIVNNWKPLTITKRSILDVAAVLDPPLSILWKVSGSIQVYFLNPEAVTRRCSVGNVSLKVSQNSQGNTCVGVSFLIEHFFYGTPHLGASLNRFILSVMFTSI